MSLRSFSLVILLCVACLATPRGQVTNPPQTPAGIVVQGIVMDTAGGVLPGVTVTLNQTEGQADVVRATTVTDGAGRFRFPNVAAGAYRLRAALASFRTTVVPLTVPARGPMAPLTVRLQIGAMSEEMTVQAAAPVVDAKRTTMGATINAAAGGRGGYVAATPPPPPAQMPGRRDAWTVVPVKPENTEAYAHVAPNPFRLTADEPLSTFAADVDTASYTNVRRFLSEGTLPPSDAVRVEEFVNYFQYHYPAPEDGRPVSITTEVGDAPWARGHRLVLVGLRAKPIDQREVGGRNIVLLLDVSGSMSSADKLPLVKTGLRMFVDNLRDDDRVAIVVYAGASGLVLPSTPARQRDRIHDAIENLQAGGSTNGGAGIRLAYQVAEDHFVRGGVNRVILATDGDFNVGTTSQGDLLGLIEEKRRSGIFLSVLGVGTGNLKDQTMEMLADKGNGHYAYLDSLQEARRVLVREGGATLETVAKDVKLQVEFNPAAVQAWRLIGYENRLLAHQDFNDDTKDGGEMGAGHTVTVLYEIVPPGVELPAELVREDGRTQVDPLVYQTGRQATGRGNGELMQVKVRYKEPDEDTSALMTQAVRGGAASTAAARELPFASAVAEFGMLLRDPESSSARWDAFVTRVRALATPADVAAERQGFAEMVELAAGLRKLRADGGARR
ncbi:MAG: von Willebrand factor type A domain-containing protein [Vicinamibacterales bacterium]